MYARARFTVEKHDNALVVPTLAVVDLQGKIGAVGARRRRRHAGLHTRSPLGIEQQDFTEITTGVKEGQRIISTGAAALRPGDRIVMAGQRGGGGGAAGGGRSRPARRRRRRRAGVNANQGQQQPGK